MIVDLPHTVTSSLYSTFFLPLSHPLFFIKSATPQQATGNHQVEKRLSETIPDAEIILFLRNQEDLILSLYNQYIKARTVYMKLDRSFISRPGSGYDLTDWNSGIKVFDLKKRYINHISLFNLVIPRSLLRGG